ncbi:MAG: DUF4403 family protein [Saprospiraceae bacterium]
MTRLLAVLVAFMFLFNFCKSSKSVSTPKVPEAYLYDEEKPVVSTITIPVDIHMDELVQSVNNRLKGPLYEDYSYRDNGGDNLMMKAEKSKDISIRLVGKTIKYQVPLKLWFKKNLYIADAEAEGDLTLSFKSDFDINPDWTIRTRTSVEYFEWTRKPVLKTGLGDINIESIANIFLNRNKTYLSKMIDDIVAKELNMRPYVEEAWLAIQEPTMLSEDYLMWIKTTPISIGMTELETNWKSIHAKIGVECYNEVSFGEKPAFLANSALPNLRKISDPPEFFQMRFVTTVPFLEAERLARDMMVGEVIESGKRKVRIDGIRMWGNNDQLVVDSELSGSFNGHLYFIGTPVFNPEKNQIEVKDLDFHTQTANVMHRSAAWLLKGPIKKRMAASMTFPVAENIAEIRTSAQDALNNYEIQPGVVLSGIIDTVSIEKTHVRPGGLQVDIFANGKLQVNVGKL